MWAILALLIMTISEEAIEQLYRNRYVGFRNALVTVAGSRESARDALQEAFAMALARREQYRGDGELAAWIWRIAYRIALRTRDRPALMPVAHETRGHREAELFTYVRINSVQLEQRRPAMFEPPTL